MKLPDIEGFPALAGRVWMNCAHQGPLPQVAAVAARQAVDWKTQPWELTTDRFSGVPARLRSALGKLLGVVADEVVLANSASYGLHLLANGLPLGDGDEVLVMDGDFPSNLLPWQGLASRGVTVREVIPAADLLTVDEVRSALSESTRVVCMSWVHSFSGRVAQIEAIGTLCRERGVLLVVNGAQAVGARRIDLSSLPIDALVGVGFKWLCGPYGTGYCWIRPELLETMTYNQRYWLSMQTAEALEGGRGVLAPPDNWGARRYDVFGTANFFNYAAWTASIERILEHGVDRIAEHDRGLVQRLCDGIDRSRYDLLAPEDPTARSTLVFISHRDPSRNRAVYDALTARGIHIAVRSGKLRVAPHFHNSSDQIDQLCSELIAAG